MFIDFLLIFGLDEKFSHSSECKSKNFFNFQIFLKPVYTLTITLTQHKLDFEVFTDFDFC